MPADQRNIELQFPLRGRNLRFSYSGQPPFSTPDCLNVRPDSTLEGRAPGGSRPGQDKAFYTQLGSGNPVRMLGSVSYVASDGLTFWSDNFTGTSLGTHWSAASWVSAAPALLPKASSSLTYNAEVGAVRTALSDLDTAQAYSIAIFITPWSGQHHGKYRIYARMAASSPNVEQDGIAAELIHTGDTGDYTGNLKVYSAGVLISTTAFTPGSIGSALPGWLVLNINGTNVTVTWRGVAVLGSTGVGAAAGTRFGFGMQCTVDGGLTLVDTFKTEYYSTVAAEDTRTLLVASANGLLYKSTTIGTMAQVSSNLTLATGHQVQCAEYLQKLYIADYDAAVLDDTGGTIAGASADELSHVGTVADWTALGLDTYNYVVRLTSSGGIVTLHEITTISTAHIHISPASSAGTYAYRIERGPKVYDPVAGTLALWLHTTDKGPIPAGCRAITVYQDRLGLAGSMDAPHVWYFSRKGDPLDWLTTSDDVKRAVNGPASEGGNVGQAVRCMFGHSADYFFAFGQTQCWVMRGDPAYGAQFNTLSPNVGALDLKAWARGPGGEIVMLTRDGIYIIEPGQGVPISTSREILPQELLDVDPTNSIILLEYDIRFRGVHIYVTPKDSRATTHWWFAWETKGFWPETYPVVQEPTCIFNYVADDASESAVILGCRDGYLRRHRRTAETDDGTAFSSYVLYGPFRGWDQLNDGIIADLDGAISEGSGTIGWSILAAQSHEAAVSATARHSGEWATHSLGGRQRTSHPRARGGSFIVKLANGDTGRRWGVENMVARVLNAGRSRR